MYSRMSEDEFAQLIEKNNAVIKEIMDNEKKVTMIY